MKFARTVRGLIAGLCGCAAAGGALAQQNLGFEVVDADLPVAWTFFDPDDDPAVRVSTDSAVAVEGSRSLRIERGERGATRVAQRLGPATFKAKTPILLRLSGAVRARDAGAASLWLRVAGEHGVLFLDSRGDAREPDSRYAESAAADPEGALTWHRYTLELPLPTDAREIALGVSLRGAGVAWFDDLSLVAIDLTELPPPAPRATAYVDAALRILEANSLHAADLDWSTLRAATLEYARGATTAQQAHAAVRYAISELGDRHSYLTSPLAATALRSRAVSNARTGQGLVAAEGRVLGGEIGYISVPGFAGGAPSDQVSFAENLKNLIQQLDEKKVCAWAIDLRRNTGGNLWPMLAGIGPLLGDREVALSVYPNGRTVGVWYRDGQAGLGDYVQLRVPEPYRLGALEPQPLAVLVGRATASSGEVLAIAFRDRPRSRAFGSPTRGLSAGNRIFTLPDGAELVLTVAATADLRGRVYSGPLEPDVAIDGGDANADGVLDAAVAWLSGQAACERPSR